MLAPGPPDGALQVVDVRDLAAFALGHLEARTADVFGVVGPPEPLTWGAFLPQVCEIAGAGTTLEWVDRPDLEEQLGDELDASLPLRDYDYQGVHRYDGRKAIDAGLSHRPLADTIADTIAWDRMRGAPSPMRAGLTVEREREVLDALEARGR
jgi:2'-hydroxyisoflavone reductase